MADGAYRSFFARAAPRLGDDGEVIRWYGFTEDVHDQRQAQLARREAADQLRESEELYRYTLELGQHIVFTADPDGLFLTMSPRFTEVTGGTAATPASDLIHPDDVGGVMTAWAHNVATGQLHNVQFRMRVLDGSYHMFRTRAAPRRDENGRIVRWYGFTEDIQEHQQEHDARLSAEERYRLAARATNDAIWDYDIVAGTVDWSEGASEMFGSPSPLGTTPIAWWEDRIHPEDMARVNDSLAAAINGDHSRWSSAYRFSREDGSYAEVFDRGFIIRDESGRALRAVGAIADLTERHEAEAEIRRIQAELIHVSRVSAMGTMASTLAHELNQPLTAVANYMRGARQLMNGEGTAHKAEVCDALEAAENAALRAGHIVRKMRELVARGTVSVAAENLPLLIEEAGVLAFVDENLQGAAHRFELDPAARWVKADRVQIQQVLINLVRNAVQAMEASPVRQVQITTRAIDGEMIEVRVADTGTGIAPELIDSLFSHFMTTKSGGMGIGLPISRTIVEAHGGKLWAENREEGGAVFCFTLPLAACRATDTTAQAKPLILRRAPYLLDAYRGDE